MVWGVRGPGGCMVPGGYMVPWGWWCLVQGGAWSPPTATAAGGTHPTGMHSCYSLVRLN